MADPKTKGEISESICKTEMVKRGVVVLEPTVEKVRYDFAVEEDGNFHRIQCKTASRRGDVLRFEVRSSQHNNTSGKRVDYKGDTDFFVVYSPDTKEVYLISIQDVGKGTKTLRLRPTKNNKTKGVTMAKDHKIDKVFGKPIL